jgi:hypothetical protein
LSHVKPCGATKIDTIRKDFCNNPQAASPSRSRKAGGTVGPGWLATRLATVVCVPSGTRWWIERHRMIADCLRACAFGNQMRLRGKKKKKIKFSVFGWQDGRRFGAMLSANV